MVFAGIPPKIRISQNLCLPIILPQISQFNELYVTLHSKSTWQSDNKKNTRQQVKGKWMAEYKNCWLAIQAKGGPRPYTLYNICYVALLCTLRASCFYIVRVVRKNNDNVDFLSQFYTLCYHNAIQPCNIFKFLSIFSTTEWFSARFNKKYSIKFINPFVVFNKVCNFVALHIVKMIVNVCKTKLFDWQYVKVKKLYFLHLYVRDVEK